MMKSGFVSIFGCPNAGKSTLLNALMGEKMAIVSHKSQTTRHRIRSFLNGPGFQAVLSDTPGILDPEYRLHERMMQAVKAGLEDADLALLIVDVRKPFQEAEQVFASLRLKVPAIVVLNKTDAVDAERQAATEQFFKERPYARQVVSISALHKSNLDALKKVLVSMLPEGAPFFPEEDLTDMPTRFFVGEIVREKIFELFEEEIPYQSTVSVVSFREGSTVGITAEIIVQRESQKAIVIGEGGRTIRELGIRARRDIEAFLGNKVFLELFVKVRPGWRDNERHLREYGYR